MNSYSSANSKNQGEDKSPQFECKKYVKIEIENQDSPMKPSFKEEEIKENLEGAQSKNQRISSAVIKSPKDSLKLKSQMQGSLTFKQRNSSETDKNVSNFLTVVSN
jgi:hypothetical protein